MKQPDKQLDDNGNFSPCSLSDNSTPSRSMVLRSYCRSSKFSVGEHSSHSRHDHSTKFHSHCQQRLDNADSFSTHGTHCASLSHSVKVNNQENIHNRACSNKKEISCEANNHEHEVKNLCCSTSTTAKSSTTFHVLNVQVSKKYCQEEAISESVELNGNIMARTFYKPLSQSLKYSEADNDVSSVSSASRDSLINRNNHHARTRFFHSSASTTSRQQQSMQDGNLTYTLSDGGSSLIDSSARQALYQNGGDSEEDEVIVADDNTLPRMQNYFSWRRYIYLIFSKPTHFDVESLAKIAAFGKWKVILLLLLPLLLALLATSWSKKGIMQQAIASNLEGDSCHFLMKWFPFNKLMWVFVPSDELESHCKGACKDAKLDKVTAVKKDDVVLEMATEVNQRIGQDVEVNSKYQTLSKEEIKVLIQEVIREEISQIFREKSNQEKLKTMSREEIEVLIQEVLKDEISKIHKEKSKQEKLKENEMQTILKELGTFALKFESLSDLFDSFRGEVNKTSEKSYKFEQISLLQNEQLGEIREKLKSLESLILESSFLAKNCCTNETQLDQKFAAMLLSVMDESSTSPALLPFREWLISKFPTKQQLLDELSAMHQKIESHKDSLSSATKAFITEHIDALKMQLVATSSTSKVIESSVSLQHIQKLIKDAIMLYDADKTGETDYALESGGGAVVNTRCSETYNEGRPSLIVFGIPLWNVKSSPRNAIQPDLHPGQCWAFRGSQGFLVIELSVKIRPTSFVVEHIPKSLSLTGSIDSAPKEFSVWGLTSEKDNDGVLLGEYTYDIDGEPLQKFPVQATDVGHFPFVELQIHSNHGNLKYTCLYRFRVHGVPL